MTNHQALVDGPSKNLDMTVPRHATALGNVVLTHIVIPKLPRAAKRGAVARAWEKNEVEQKWEESAWAKRRAIREKRRSLSDFDRFRVLKLNKQVSADAADIHERVLRSQPSGARSGGTRAQNCPRLWTHADSTVHQKRFEVRKALAKVRSSAKAS